MNPKYKPWWTSAVVYYLLGLVGVLFWLAASIWLMSKFGGLSFSSSNYSKLFVVVILLYGIYALLHETANETAMKWFRRSRLDTRSSTNRSVEDRLDELERLKRRDMVTPEEYAAKRQEILKDL